LNAGDQGDRALLLPSTPGADATPRRHGRPPRAFGPPMRSAYRHDARGKRSLSLRVVTAEGEGHPLRPAPRERSPRRGTTFNAGSSSGSEGTLGIHHRGHRTGLYHPSPRAVSAAVVPLPRTSAGAVNTVIRTIQRGVPDRARAELLDALTRHRSQPIQQDDVEGSSRRLFPRVPRPPRRSVEEQAESVQQIARGERRARLRLGGRSRGSGAALWGRPRHTGLPGPASSCGRARRAFRDGRLRARSRGSPSAFTATIEDTPRVLAAMPPARPRGGRPTSTASSSPNPSNPAEMEGGRAAQSARHAPAPSAMDRNLHRRARASGNAPRSRLALTEEFGDAAVELMAPAQGGVGPAQHPQPREGRHHGREARGGLAVQEDVSSPGDPRVPQKGSR